MNPASHQPLFSQTPVVVSGRVSVSNSNLDGVTGTYTTLVTGATDGTRISYIRLKALVATTAGMIRFFVNDGTTVNLILEVPVTAITPSGTVQSFEATVDFEFNAQDEISAFVLANGDTLLASTQNAELMAITVLGSNYTAP